MRNNIESARAHKLRNNAPEYDTLKFALTGPLTVSSLAPSVLFLDPNGSDRDVFLPAIAPAGGQEYKIYNIGSANSLTIRDSGGVSIVVLAINESAILNSSATAWSYVKTTSVLSAPSNADYLVKTADATLSAERVVTDGAAAGLAVWDWSVAGTVKANLWASVADRYLYSTGANAWSEGTITAAGRAILDDATAADQRTTLGAAASGANTDITSVYLNNTGLKVKDTNASHGLSIVPGSDITADRVLTITTGDADRTLTISASATVSQDYSTAGNPQFATVEVGHASDTSVARSAAGLLSVEGNIIPHVAYAATWTKPQTPGIVALSSGVGADFSTGGQTFTAAVSGAFTISNPSANPATGTYVSIVITMTAAGSVSWGANFKGLSNYTQSTWTSGTLKDHLVFRWDGTTYNLCGVANGNNL